MSGKFDEEETINYGGDASNDEDLNSPCGLQRMKSFSSLFGDFDDEETDSYGGDTCFGDDSCGGDASNDEKQ